MNPWSGKQHESLEVICPDRSENRQRLNVTSLHIQGLDTKMQMLIQSLSQGSEFEELKDLIQNELGEQFNSKIQQYERRQEEKEYRTQLLDSLWYAEILSREETIAEAHSETFQWIFDKSGLAVRPWDNFSAWLENGEGIYWVNGKAGSGKSTLMSFLCQDDRTIQALEVWSETKILLMPKFYFWSSGTTMQKSFEGLLRSLLWQILNELPNTTALPVTFGSLPERNRSTALGHSSIGAWTRSRLQRTLQQAIGQLQSSCRLCFFLDGLDESEEDHDELITFVRDIVSKSGAKVCLSSRPYKIFEDAFGSSAKLRLQDLTHKDVQRYVEDKFQDVPRLASMISENGYEMNKLKEQIVAKAEGVFLWVKLAVKDQIRGLRNDDSPEQLQERLACLPSEIEGIYLRMLLQIDKPYRQQASCFLRMALYQPGLSLLEHALASYKELEAMLLSDHNVSTQKIASLCQRTRDRIITRCAGLLEVHEPSNQDTESETSSHERDSEHMDAGSEDDMSASDFEREILDDSKPGKENKLQNLKPEKHGQSSGSESEITDVQVLELQSHTHVDFIHRTAVDFLETTGPGKKFLEDSSAPEFDPQILSIKALLGILRLMGPMSYPISYHPRVSLDSIDDIMPEIAKVEDRAGRPQTRLCELVDGTMSVSDRLHSRWRPNSHWCMRWGIMAELCDGGQAYTTSSSRSSSTNSFHSATSEFPTFDRANPTPTDSIRFLGFAASHNLVHYVQQMLDCRETSVSLESLDYLLRCSISAYASPSWLPGRPDSSGPLKVVRALLRRGANPNAKLFAKTIWREILERTAVLWNGFFLTDLSDYKLWHSETWISNSKTLTSSIIAFIEKGADMGAICNFHLKARGDTHNRGPINSWYEFDMQLSALSTIQLVLGHTPDFPRIQEMCIARGALLYSRCTILGIRISTEELIGSYDMRQYELSKRESEEFVAILEQFAALRSNKLEDDLAIFRRQLREFFGRLEVIRSNDPNSSRMRTSIARETRQGSEWYTHKSFFDRKNFGFRDFRSQQAFFDAPSSPPQRHDCDSSSSHEE